MRCSRPTPLSTTRLLPSPRTPRPSPELHQRLERPRQLRPHGIDLRCWHKSVAARRCRRLGSVWAYHQERWRAKSDARVPAREWPGRLQTQFDGRTWEPRSLILWLSCHASYRQRRSRCLPRLYNPAMILPCLPWWTPRCSRPATTWPICPTSMNLRVRPTWMLIPRTQAQLAHHDYSPASHSAAICAKGNLHL